MINNSNTNYLVNDYYDSSHVLIKETLIKYYRGRYTVAMAADIQGTLVSERDVSEDTLCGICACTVS